jgi:hypothetical protein
MGLRADRKKIKNKVHIGSFVTWGLRECAHPVVEIQEDGVIVDARPCLDHPRYFVSYEGGRRGKGAGVSPLAVVDAKATGTCVKLRK